MTDSCLDATSHTISSISLTPLNILDLPDNILFHVLCANDPDEETIINTRRICRRFNDLLNTTALQVDMVRTHFPIAGSLYYSKDCGLRSIFPAIRFNRRLQANLQIVLNAEYATSLKSRPALVRGVEQGLALLGWIAYRSRRNPGQQRKLTRETMVGKNSLSLRPLLAIACAMIWLFKTIPQSQILEMRSQAESWGPIASSRNSDSVMLLLFQEAVLDQLGWGSPSLWVFDNQKEGIFHLMHNADDVLEWEDLEMFPQDIRKQRTALKS